MISSLKTTNDTKSATVQKSISQQYENYSAPSWTKKMFQWYDQGKITEDELLSFVKWLIANKIMGS